MLRDRTVRPGAAFALASALSLSATLVHAGTASCGAIGVDLAGRTALAAIVSIDFRGPAAWVPDATNAFRRFLAEAACAWQEAPPRDRPRLARGAGAWIRHLHETAEDRWGPAPLEVRSGLAGARLRGVVSGVVEELEWPVPTLRLTSPYGHREDPIRGGRGGFHHGLDLGARAGTPVRSAGYGVVVEAGERGSLGRVVVVRHTFGLVSWYAHLQTVEAEVADFVTPDTTIGSVGATGRATAPHLHFELRRDGRSLDPRRLLPSAVSGLRP